MNPLDRLKLSVKIAAVMWLIPSITHAQAASYAFARCQGQEQAGLIETLAQQPGARSTDKGRFPKINIAGKVYKAYLGARLCAGDIVVNPAGSGMDVGLRLKGGSAFQIGPGAFSTVPKPRLAFMSPTLREKFNRDFSGKPPDEPAIVKRSDWSVSSETMYANAVAAWGPLILRWPQTASLGAPDGPWTVTLTDHQVMRRWSANEPYFRLNVAADCAKTCKVTVFDVELRPAAAFVIMTLSEADAPAIDIPAQEQSRSPALDAVRGEQLFQSDDPLWRIQAASLVLNAACEEPGVGSYVAESGGPVDDLPCAASGSPPP